MVWRFWRQPSGLLLCEMLPGGSQLLVAPWELEPLITPDDLGLYRSLSGRPGIVWAWRGYWHAGILRASALDAVLACCARAERWEK